MHYKINYIILTQILPKVHVLPAPVTSIYQFPGDHEQGID